MPKSKRIQKSGLRLCTGLLVTAAVFTVLLCLTALLVKLRIVNDSLLRLFLPLECLTAGTAGALCVPGKDPDRLTELLVGGVVPAGTLLLFGLLSGEEGGATRTLLWNAASLLLPYLLALLPGGSRSGKRRK